MSWFTIILLAYLILSVSNLIDKIFLSHFVTQSIVYTVWVGLLSVGLVALFVMHWFLDHDAYTSLKALGSLTLMSPWLILIALVIGIVFIAAIYCLYSSLQGGEASRVLPLIGGSMPVMIYFITVWYDPLEPRQLLSFAVLVVGTILISWSPGKGRHDTSAKSMWYGLGAALFFAIYFTLNQVLLNREGFINGIVWPRLGSAMALLALLLNPTVRHKLSHSLSHLSLKMRAGWLGSQGLGALGFVGQLYAISIPGVSVALVVALQSVQYAFILLLASILTVFRPRLLREYITTNIIVQKVAALVCIGVGLYLISG